MNAFLEYKKIQEFKSGRAAIQDGVNYAHVVAPLLYDKSVFGFFKKLIFSSFFTTRISVSELKENSLLLYYSCRNKQRRDYDFISQRLREILGARCDYVETSELFSLAQLFYTLKELPSSWRGAKGYTANTLQRLGAALLVAKYRSTARRIFPPLLRGKHKLVTFCDAQAPENLLTQMANAVGVETYTNQHGQYRILDATNISADAEAYANFVSNYILCWGEATQNEFVRFGFKNEQLIITGWIKQWEYVAPHPPLRVFGVMLNGENGKESNAALLETAQSIASSLNLRYIVRLHPWSKPKEYADFLDNRCAGIGHYGLSSYLKEVDFSLAHMSGATIEVLHSGALAYLLDDGKLPEVFRTIGLSFNSPDAITAAISQDMLTPNLAIQRVQEISKWFNDDHAQAARICAALLDNRN